MVHLCINVLRMHKCMHKCNCGSFPNEMPSFFICTAHSPLPDTTLQIDLGKSQTPNPKPDPNPPSGASAGQERGRASSCAPTQERASMPSLLTWNYDGGEEGSEDAKRRGKQHAGAGYGHPPGVSRACRRARAPGAPPMRPTNPPKYSYRVKEDLSAE